MPRHSSAVTEGLPSALAACAAGTISPHVAAMRLLLEYGYDHARAIAERLGPRSHPLSIVRTLLRDEERKARCATVIETLRAIDRARFDDPVEASRRLFDEIVDVGVEASAALYSLGDPSTLAVATAEVVECMRALGVLGRARAALDLGCGTGRIARALSEDLALVDAVDVSPRSIEIAKRVAPDNVRFMASSGRDLASFEDEGMDLVYAVDVLPYLHTNDFVVLARMFEEVARVLTWSGDFVFFNYSYRQDLGADRAEVSVLAREYGFEVVVSGALPFRLWDASAFHLKKVA